MNKDVIDDLKQFITAAISQQIDGLETRIDNRFEDSNEKLNEILDVLGQNQQRVDDTLDNHERRIVKLEQKAA
ncbi:MAG: hypothetical protein ACHQTE_02435 [Candidatus Saccharimonadales bacterium]